ncbi:MAG: hypothetical protein LBI27_02230 [Clostridiales bacterium]|jgi:L-rhamnose mutarotase|nr:hypothetical protein [Clostridiales bacterium]
MTGHHIYTRSWYEHGSRTKSAGTFTVELTDGLFLPDTHDVIYNKLNPVLAGTQPSIAGYTQDKSLLRVVHPTADSTVVWRSYFVDDKLTKRGVVQYSFGLVFVDDEKNKANSVFLNNPDNAFKISAFESYDDFAKRVNEDGVITYSNAYDPKPGDYSSHADVTRDEWLGFGFDEEIFSKFFVSLCKCITSQKAKDKLAVILPEGETGEKLILNLLTVLPAWLRKKFGAVSNWSGATDGSSASAIDGIQLVCYVGAPPHDTSISVIDLSGGEKNKNIETPSEEILYFVKWFWNNIDNPAAIKKLSDFMKENYKELIDKMPFDVFVHCFWLWDAVQNTSPDSLDFATASTAINSLVNVFGKSLDKHFKDEKTLKNIFNVFTTQLENVPVSQINVGEVRSICQLANGDFELGEFVAREVVALLFNNLFYGNQINKLEAVLQYYAKIIKENAPQERIPEAIDALIKVLGVHDKKIADEVALVLSKCANDIVVTMLKTGGTKYFKDYQNIVEGLKNVGRQMSMDISSWDTKPGNEQSSRLFFLIEKYNREKIANINPPNSNQLDNIVAALKFMDDATRTDNLKQLLSLYWEADALKDKAQLQKYVFYLRDNKKLHFYLRFGVGTEEIRQMFVDEFNKSWAAVESASIEIKIEELYKWWNMLHDCGFANDDEIYRLMQIQIILFDLLKGMSDIWKTIHPKSVKQAYTMFEHFPKAQPDKLKIIVDFDDEVNKGMELYLASKKFKSETKRLLARIEYFSSNIEATPEWALTRVVIEARASGDSLSDSRAAEKYLEYSRSDGNPKQDIKKLNEALKLLEGYRYGTNEEEEIFVSLLTRIHQCVSANTFDDLENTARMYEIFTTRVAGNNPHIKMAGKYIGDEIAAVCNGNGTELPSMTTKFRPARKQIVQYEPHHSNELEDVLTLFFVISVFISTVSGLILAIIGGGAAIMNIAPFPVAVILLVMAIASFVVAFIPFFKRFISGIFM